VDDAKPHRRFQFSVRKLMLWMVALAVYLAFFVRLVGTPLVVFVTIYFAVIAVIRMTWAPKKCLAIATLFSGTGWGCLWLDFCVTDTAHYSSQELPLSVCVFVIGLVVGLIAFGLVHGVVRCVNSLDQWIGTRTQRR
jgi:hypothetical protein